MKNKLTFKTSVVFLIFSISLLSSNLINSQDRNIFELTTQSNNRDRSDFYDLAFNLKPTAYFKDNAFRNQYGEGSILKITFEDTNSFDALANNQGNYDSAELIIIKVNNLSELNQTVDLMSLTSLNKLKYIFIKCFFKTNKQQVENFISANPNIRVFYFAQNPS
ncbi:hypothetical protein [Cognatitamlana onchidii]|uniref:hypothetical protein n=1 Tax=Cognatitamlana onchidii TaxID=2562860 RepID=UPI0010A5C8DA|nr:hypothetical protein [Algibacter onchidii]